jgi:hypothetical protein
MMKSMTKRTLTIVLAIMMLVATCVVYTVSAADRDFALDMKATASASDSSIINVVITVKNIKQELDAVEFTLNFDKSLVQGVVTESGTAMNTFITTSPVYTFVSGSGELSLPRYEQICTYDAAKGSYTCRFADLLEYVNAKDGETYTGLLKDGELVITIPFKILSGVSANAQFAFSATNVKGTATNGLKSVAGEEASVIYKSSAAQDYYLVGFINNADYGCNADSANLGQYKFVNGKLTATFNADSYVFVKTGDNANWYMTKTYCQDTTAKFYKTTTGASEKLFVPGNVAVTFTLTENSDGTLTLSYTTPSVAKPTVSAKSFSLSFESEILVNFYYAVSDLTGVAEHGMLVFNSNPAVVSYAGADEVYNDSVYDSAKARYMATTDGIAAKRLGDTRYYAAYAKLTDGSYVYSKTYDYSPKKYATNMLSKSTTSEKQKALCVAMLNYGAAAQKYFGYNTGSLMNADLTAAQQAMVIAYNSTLFTGTVPVNSSKVGSFAATSTGFSKKSVTVSFDGAFAINYYFTPSAAVSGNMTMYCWDAATYASVGTLTAANASEVVKMTATDDGRYWEDVSGIAAKCLDDTYYVAAVYTDANGNRYCTGVVAYSLSKYCINNAKDGKAMQELAAATAMYGYYAKAYFS